MPKQNISGLIEIPARGGKAHAVAKGQSVKLINTHGNQVVDTWAYNAAELSEHMSMEATRATIKKLIPAVSDTLYTNNRHKILTLTEDTTPGIHDTLMAACDNYRYGLLGCTDYHDNCSDNLKAAMKDLGHSISHTPAPLNMFMNIPWTPDGALSFEAPTSSPGEYAVFRAEMDLIIAFSACPQDMLPVNGVDTTPTNAHFEVT